MQLATILPKDFDFYGFGEADKSSFKINTKGRTRQTLWSAGQPVKPDANLYGQQPSSKIFSTIFSKNFSRFFQNIFQDFFKKFFKIFSKTFLRLFQNIFQDFSKRNFKIFSTIFRTFEQPFLLGIHEDGTSFGIVLINSNALEIEFISKNNEYSLWDVLIGVRKKYRL